MAKTQKTQVQAKDASKKSVCQNDDHCPFCGSLKVRGRNFMGTVTSTKMRRSAVVRWEHRRFVPKYERYERRFTKLTVHAPDCQNVKEGDVVRIAETRPLSKTKHFVVIENLGPEKGYLLKKEALEESKKTKVRKEKDGEDNESS